MSFRHKPQVTKDDYHDASIMSAEWSDEGDLKFRVQRFAHVSESSRIMRQVVNRSQVKDELAECIANREGREVGWVSGLHAERLPTGGLTVKLYLHLFHVDDRTLVTIVCKAIDEW